MRLVVLAALLGGCSSGSDAHRVVFLGLDGLDPVELQARIDAGEAPNFAKLRREGGMAELTVDVRPIWSPVIWTGLATALPPEKHGITHWAQPDGEVYDATDVRSARVWEVAAAQGKRPLVAGWLLTYPTAELDGYVLTQRIGKLKLLSADPTGVAHPPELVERAQAWLPDRAWVRGGAFGDQARLIRTHGSSHPLRADEVVVRAFEALWQTEKLDLAYLYLAGADRLGHLGSQLEEKGVEGVALRPWVESYYAYLDEALGRVMALVDPETTTLIVASDHGFRLDGADAEDHRHRDPGVLLAWGGRTRRAPPSEPVTQRDLARTLWVLSGAPLAEDQEGSVLGAWFHVDEAVPTRATYTTGPAKPSPKDTVTDVLTTDRAQQLQALGYLNPDGTPVGAPAKGKKARGPTPVTPPR